MRERRMDFQDTITVLVGAKEERFCAHKDVLCATSGFFQDAFSGNWLENKERTIRITEQQPVAFEIYLTYCYQHTIDHSMGDEQCSHDELLKKGASGQSVHRYNPGYLELHPR
jgi:hypothetical protein